MLLATLWGDAGVGLQSVPIDLIDTVVVIVDGVYLRRHLVEGSSFRIVCSYYDSNGW